MKETTDLSISEIAYDLGFEHSQSFKRKLNNRRRNLFKRFTQMSISVNQIKIKRRRGVLFLPHCYSVFLFALGYKVRILMCCNK